MGQVYANIQVVHPGGEDARRIPNVLIDTGSFHTVLPASLLNALQVERKDVAQVRVVGQEAEWWDVGEVGIRMLPQDQIWTCPVAFGPEEEYLVGATTLEIFGLMVDPVEEGLVKRTFRIREGGPV